MTKLVGNELPDRLLNHLNGTNIPSKSGRAILITTVDENSWPHIALLSFWEVLAKNRRNIRLATYPSSRTASNLKRGGKVTIVMIDRGMTYYIKGSATLVQERLDREPSISVFNTKVEHVLEDFLPGAEITSGITYVEHVPVEEHEQVFAELLKS